MTPCQSTDHRRTRPDPIRWSRDDIAAAWDEFAAPDHPSQRQYAREQRIPRSTVGAWLRDDCSHHPDLDPDLVAFLRSRAGQRFLRRLLLALFVVFVFGSAAGIRLIGRFLRLCQLDRFVASSYGALHGLARHLEDDLAAFDAAERPRLAQQMQPRTIALVPDENFHGPDPCLVALEPVSNFIVVECYRPRRDGDTWTEAIRDGLRGLPVQVLLLNSDLASGLLRCAREGLEVMHSPDLFHGQRELLKPTLLPLSRQVQQAREALEAAQQQVQPWLDAEQQARAAGQEWQLSYPDYLQLWEATRQQVLASQQLERSQARQDQLVEQVRGLGDDYHPFDRQTGQPVKAAAAQQRLEQRLAAIESVVEQAGLGKQAQAAVQKSRTWLGALVAVVAWFWSLAERRVEELGLSEAAEQLVYERLLPGLYWRAAAGRARTAQERERLRELAERLQQQAWRSGGALAALPVDERQQAERVAREVAGLFSRSSSCVEGRNGRLALYHHGQGRLSERKLKALTVVHNYLVERADGTSAAERFFGTRPRDPFTWLLERLPDLPRPAAKRPPKTAPSTPRAG
jgi:hypothetical protein